MVDEAEVVERSHIVVPPSTRIEELGKLIVNNGAIAQLPDETSLEEILFAARAEAAPTMAYVPGVTQGTSGSQEEKMKRCGKADWKTSTLRPTARP